MLDAHHTLEVLSEGHGVDAKTTCHIQHCTSREGLAQCTLLARALLEGTGRNYATCLIQSRELTTCTLQILDLCCHKRSMGHALT